MLMFAKSSSGFFKQGNTSENNEKWWVIGENHELSKDPFFKGFFTTVQSLLIFLKSMCLKTFTSKDFV